MTEEEQRKHDDQFKLCENVFVSWRWAIGILAAIFMTTIGLAWAGGSKMNTLTTQIEEQKSQIVDLKERIDKKLDILISQGEAKR
jgi:hypothetical protein